MSFDIVFGYISNKGAKKKENFYRIEIMTPTFQIFFCLDFRRFLSIESNNPAVLFQQWFEIT